MYTITNVIRRSIIPLHIQYSYIYAWRNSPCFSLPLLVPFCSPFMSPSTYLAPSSCDRNRPPPSQVACKLTPFAPPFTQLSHPFQNPRTPTAQRLTKTTLGIFRLLLSGTRKVAFQCMIRIYIRPALECYSSLYGLEKFNDVPQVSFAFQRVWLFKTAVKSLSKGSYTRMGQTKQDRQNPARTGSPDRHRQNRTMKHV
jgi:hypothetical protein